METQPGKESPGLGLVLPELHKVGPSEIRARPITTPASSGCSVRRWSMGGSQPQHAAGPRSRGGGRSEGKSWKRERESNP